MLLSSSKYWWNHGFVAIEVISWEFQIEARLNDLGYSITEFKHELPYEIIHSYREKTLDEVIETFLDKIICGECGNDIRHGSHRRVDVDHWICKG